MTAITITDLENAALDVATIGSIANSTSPVVTDRLGQSRPTMTALAAEYPAASANAASALASKDAALASKISAESARDAAIINSAVYATEALGRAAVADNIYFRVIPGAAAPRIASLLYQRLSASESRLVTTLLSSAATDGLDQFQQLDPLTSDILPLLGVPSVAGAIQAPVAYRQSTSALEENGVPVMTGAKTDARLNPVFEGLVTLADAALVPLLGVPSTSGDTQVVVGYNTATNALQVNGVDLPTATALAAVVSANASVKAAFVPVAAGLVPTFAAISHLMTYGQSLSKGFNSLPIYSTTQPYLNLSFASGPKSTKAGSVGNLGGMDAFAPLIENGLNGDGVDSPATGESPCSSWANGLVKRQAIENGADWRTGIQYLATANGMGSAGINNLLPGGTSAMGEWYQVVRDSIAQAKALSTAAGKAYSLPVVCYMQGEGDNADAALAGGVWGTKLGTLHAAIESTYRGINGGTDKVWLGVYQTYARTKSERPHATIDQLDYAESTANAFLVTPIYHLQTSLGGDGHLSARGSYHFGRYLAKKTKVLADGFVPQWVKKPKATLSGNVVRLYFPQVPVRPLRFVADGNLKITTNYGFAVRDSTVTTVGSSLAIASIAVTAEGNEVLITLSATPSGAVTVRYGLDYLPTGNYDYSGSAGGQLVDSDPDTFTWPVDGLLYPLYNICPHFSISAIPV